MANEKTARGVVAATAQNAPDRYGLRIGRAWFDGFGTCPVEKGDAVEVVYGYDGEFRDIHEVKRVEASSVGAVGASRGEGDARDARIARAVALKAAARLYGDRWISAKEVTDTAGKLEQWLLRAG